MSSINSIAVSGRIARDPEIRHLPSGTAVFENAIAVEHYRKDEENKVSFLNFKVYGAFAELLSKKLRKGDLAVVSGRVEEETWEKDGEKRSKVVIIAQDVEGEFKFRSASESEAPSEPAAAADDDIPF